MLYNDLINNAEQINLDFDESKFKLALLGNFATQFLSKAIKASAVVNNIGLSLYDAQYDQIENEIINPSSQLYEFLPDGIMICFSARKLRPKFQILSNEEKQSFAIDFISKLKDLFSIIESRLITKILLSNIEELDDAIFGNFGSNTNCAFVSQIRRLNVLLMDLVQQNKNIFIVDVQNLLVRKGIEFSFSAKFYVNADLVYSLDFTAEIANQAIKVIQSSLGKFKKCLILDLDNTLWGGVVGDDGIEGIEIGSLGIGKAFTEFQKWIKSLVQRGIIVAVCSKNEESTAKDVFKNHTEMILRLSDIAVFVANWKDKTYNIKEIQNILNIGYDSMVFIDDNPLERQLVREMLPEILVPELPEDPSDYLEYLIGQSIFETSSFSVTDTVRTKQYQQEIERNSFSKNFSNIDLFLKSIGMKSRIGSILAFDVQRIAQLSQRSNQFNLRTVRLSISDTEKIINSNDYLHYAVYLDDNFGDYGLVSFVILEKQNDSTLFICNWIMSCRVANRDLEKFILNKIVEDAKMNGFSRIVGEYIPSKKNMPVANHYEKLNFLENNGNWFLELGKFVAFKTNIEKQ